MKLSPHTPVDSVRSQEVVTSCRTRKEIQSLRSSKTLGARRARENFRLGCNHLLEAISESERNVPHFICQGILSSLIKKDATDVSGGKLGSGSYDKYPAQQILI